MVGLHNVVGAAMIAANAAATVLALVYIRLRREPHRAYLHVLAFAQVTIIAQVLIGLLLLGGNRRSPDSLHYLYGAVALAAAFAPWFYGPKEPERRLVWFAGATAVAAGLGARGFVTAT